MNGHFCTAGCGKVITWRFAICADCEQIYGNRAASWPDWLRELWNFTQRDRRRWKKQKEHEILFSDMEKAIGIEE